MYMETKKKGCSYEFRFRTKFFKEEDLDLINR